MHIRKAKELLWELSSAPATLETFVAATVLLDSLEKDNNDIEEGERVNGTAREKIREARSWFESLCGLGEDGEMQEDKIRHFLRCDISEIEHQIEARGHSASSRFKRWRAVDNPD